MDKIRITNKLNPLYSRFKKLYSGSFPVFEQRTVGQQDAAFSSHRYHLTAYEENGTFVGFISYWEFDTYIYIEHFAVDTKLRGTGYGSLILNSFAKEQSKVIILEIDPVTDDISASRLRFYEKCSFHKNDYNHIHPPYRKGYDGHRLIVLSSNSKISCEEYELFSMDLKNIVMAV